MLPGGRILFHETRLEATSVRFQPEARDQEGLLCSKQWKCPYLAADATIESIPEMFFKRSSGMSCLILRYSSEL